MKIISGTGEETNIEEVQVLDLRPGDVLVVKTQGNLCDEEVERMKVDFAKYVKVPIVVLCNAEIEVIRNGG